MLNSKGFTLIEIILVIVILAIVVPGVIGAVSFMTQSQVNPLATTTAANLARERMEQVIADKRNPAIPFIDIDEAVRYPDDTPVAGYDRRVRVTCVDPVANPGDVQTAVVCPTNYRRIEVTVSPTAAGPSAPDVVLVTLLTDF